MKHLHAHVRWLLFTSTVFFSSCNVKYDTVSFAAAGMMIAGKTPVPSVEIDTNVSSGMMGGDVKSNKPYDIRAYYLDDTFTFASAEFTKVSVTYADGTTDPGIVSLRLPITVNASNHESHNSMAGGAVVVNKSRILRAEFAQTISRDESFTLQIEGSFRKDDGTVIPFTIKETYNMSRQSGTESWADFVSGC